ncbi:hypothetical protein DPMN_109136 [Dreissena polymorpha]|uniref:Uncharacterized protein n=1 Tax=Dreissena polymorpha TaxID=45954 RepID=A0A9D4KA33_DREPO|nr:hypothetical protein DPMN_109136 [Dreissena polymorpha]
MTCIMKLIDSISSAEAEICTQIFSRDHFSLENLFVTTETGSSIAVLYAFFNELLRYAALRKPFREDKDLICISNSGLISPFQETHFAAKG